MTSSYRSQLSSLLLSGQVLEAISTIRTHINEASYLYTQELDELEHLYRQALGYRVQGIQDPEYPRIHQRIVSRLLSLSQILELEQELPRSYHLYHSHYKQYWLSSNALSVESLIQQLGSPSSRVEYDRLMLQLFAKLWSARELTEVEGRLCLSLWEDSYLCCVVASALTLSLQEYWSEQKFLLLLRLLEHAHHQVRARAIAGVVICLRTNAAAIELSSPSISIAWEGVFQAHTQLVEEFRETILALYRVQESEDLGRRVQQDLSRSWEELSPEVKRHMMRLGSKNMLEQMSEDEAPEWLEELRQSDMANRIQQVNKLQHSGMDVMFSSFVNLKQHSFFREVMHWFIPLNLRHSALSALPGIERLSQDSLSSLGIALCDNDAYSLVLAMTSLPEEMRKSLLDNILELPENSPLAERASSAPLAQELKSYIEGLYRFYKLFDRKVEFEDIFSEVIPLDNLPLLSPVLSDPALLHKVGDILIQQRRYTDAVATYRLLGAIAPLDALTYEKLGWSHAQLGQMQEALEAYQRADLIAGDNTRLYKQMAECARLLHRYAEAIGYYEQCTKLSSEEITSGTLLLSQANCYIALGDFSSALSLGYRYELTRQPSLASMRIIAYSLLMQGSCGEAEEYYLRISTEAGCKGADLMQYAHAILMQQRYSEALELYRSSHSMLGRERFMELWAEERELLLGLGLDADYFLALSEYLRSL